VLLLDEYDVDKIAADGTVTHFIDCTAGAGVYPVYAICDDGSKAYWVTNATSGGTTKLTVFGKPLTGSSASTADEFKIFDNSQIITNATIEYVKQRLVICADNKVYECPPAVSSTPTLLYTHPATTHVYTSVTASGPAIYISGYNGIQSTIVKFTLSTAGVMPTLTSAVVAAELPVGEVVHKIYYYLGRMLIGTNKGIRAATVSDVDGSPRSMYWEHLMISFSTRCFARFFLRPMPADEISHLSMVSVKNTTLIKVTIPCGFPEVTSLGSEYESAAKMANFFPERSFTILSESKFASSIIKDSTPFIDTTFVFLLNSTSCANVRLDIPRTKIKIIDFIISKN
jgi:hypothetical protein